MGLVTARGLFCLKFLHHGNSGDPEINLHDAVKLADPENHTIKPKIRLYLACNPSYNSFNNLLNFPVGACDGQTIRNNYCQQPRIF